MPADSLSLADQPVLAAIDIGTNSIHMVVVRIDPRLADFTIISREKATVRLGEVCPETGALTDKAMQRAMEALERCVAIARSHGATGTVAVATSAVREAPNGVAFLQRVDERLGLAVDLISGQEEARRIYLGVLSAMDFHHLPHVIMDIGGGSTELILGDGREPQFLHSLKLGAVRLTEQFFSSDPPRPEQIERLRHYVASQLERPTQQILGLLGSQPVRLVGTSGTVESLAGVEARRRLGAIPPILQGYELGLASVTNLIEELLPLNKEERVRACGIQERRAEIIVAGAMILQETMRQLGADRIMVCERALREGLIVDWMLTHGLIADRLRYQSSVRRRHVLKLAHKYQVELPYAERVTALTLSLFDQLRGTVHNWGDGERELLAAAAMLHNCGHFINHSSHHKHSYYLIRHDELLGFTEEEIEIIANIARYHRKSPPKRKHPNFQALTEERHQRLVCQLSALLRLGVALDRRRSGMVQWVRCEPDLPRGILRLILKPSQAGDLCQPERWSLDYNKQVFEKEFNLQVVVQLEQPSPFSLSLLGEEIYSNS
ncbi:MAG: Ppx/GppA phosphatase family protein [Thermostichales cyanobacterium SZTDM-1c_bins_54]